MSYELPMLPFCQIANIAILEIWQFGDFGAVGLSFFAGKQVWRLSGVNSAEPAEREMNDRKPLLLLGKIMCGCVNGACGVNTTTTAERGGSKKTKQRKELSLLLQQSQQRNLTNIFSK